MFDDKKLERIEALEEEVKEQKNELERTLSMFNSLLKRCNQLSEENAKLRNLTTETREHCKREFASVDRVLEKHGNRIYPAYFKLFPQMAKFEDELDSVFEKKAPSKS